MSAAFRPVFSPVDFRRTFAGEVADVFIRVTALVDAELRRAPWIVGIILENDTLPLENPSEPFLKAFVGSHGGLLAGVAFSEQQGRCLRGSEGILVNSFNLRHGAIWRGGRGRRAGRESEGDEERGEFHGGGDSFLGVSE